MTERERMAMLKHINDCQRFIAECYQFFGWVSLCERDKEYPRRPSAREIQKMMYRCLRLNKLGDKYYEDKFHK